MSLEILARTPGFTIQHVEPDSDVAVLLLTTPLQFIRPVQALAILRGIAQAGCRITFQGTDFLIVERELERRKL